MKDVHAEISEMLSHLTNEEIFINNQIEEQKIK